QAPRQWAIQLCLALQTSGLMLRATQQVLGLVFRRDHRSISPLERINSTGRRLALACGARGRSSARSRSPLLRRWQQTGLAPLWWTFQMSRAEPVENVRDDSASKTIVYT